MESGSEPQMPNLPEGGARERASDSIDSEWLEHAFSRPCVDNSGSRRNSESCVGTSISVIVPVNNGNGGFANVPDAMAIPQKYKPDVNSLGKAVKDGNERHNGSDIKSRIEESDFPIASALPLTTEKTIKADSENPTARRAQAFTNSEYIDRRLNILVAGASGLGKTTLLRAVVHALCRQYGCMEQWDKFLRRNGEEVVKTTSQKPQEKARLSFPWSNDTKLIVTIIDSRGFGDQLDERKSFEPIQQYIKDMYESYSQKYDTGRVTPLEDPRVHCCLYFLQPTRFRENDKTHMKALEDFCPIVPVIAKADTLGIDEINEFLLRGYCNCTPEQVKKIKLHGESNLPMDDAIVGDSNMAKAECLNTSETESPALGVLASIQKTKIEIFRLESNASPCFKIKCLEGPKGFKVVVEDVYAMVARDKFLPDGAPEPRPYAWGDCSIQNPYHSDFARLEAMLFRGRNKGMKRLIEETERRYLSWRLLKKQREAEQDPIKRNNKYWMSVIVTVLMLLVTVYAGRIIEFAPNEPFKSQNQSHLDKDPGCIKKECSKRIIAADNTIERLLLEVKGLKSRNWELKEGLTKQKEHVQKLEEADASRSVRGNELKAIVQALQDKNEKDLHNYQRHIRKLEEQTRESIKRETDAVKKKLTRCRKGMPEHTPISWFYEWIFQKLNLVEAVNTDL